MSRSSLGFVVATAAIFATQASVLAAPTKMTCRNPSRSYAVLFDAQARTFVAGGTAYRVLAIENAGGVLAAAGVTVADGPAFRAEMRPRKQIEFFAGGKLFQTDPCR